MIWRLLYLPNKMVRCGFWTGAYDAESKEIIPRLLRFCYPYETIIAVTDVKEE